MSEQTPFTRSFRQPGGPRITVYEEGWKPVQRPIEATSGQVATAAAFEPGQEATVIVPAQDPEADWKAHVQNQPHQGC